jgi:gas vesicle protein
MSPHQKNYLRKGIILLFVAAVLFSVFSRSGEQLDKALKDEAKAIPELIKAAQDNVKDDQKKYARLKNSKQFQPIQIYAQKEDWDSRFKQADDQLRNADAAYDNQLRPLIKENSPEVAPAVKQKIKQIKTLIEQAKKNSSTAGSALFQDQRDPGQYRAILSDRHQQF